MNCLTFQIWLDEGMPTSPAGTARAAADHAGQCSSCAAAWQAAREVDRALADFAPAAPAGFSSRLLARLEPHLGAKPIRIVWWKQVWFHPEFAVSLGLGLVLLVLFPYLRDLAVRLSALLQEWSPSILADTPAAPRGWMGAIVSSGMDPILAILVAVVVLSAFGWFSIMLYRRVERLIRLQLG